MATTNVHDAKTHFSKLLARTEQGEEIIIARAGRPVAKLVPIRASSHVRILGADAGLFEIPADFDGPLDEDLLGQFGA